MQNDSIFAYNQHWSYLFVFKITCLINYQTSTCRKPITNSTCIDNEVPTTIQHPLQKNFNIKLIYFNKTNSIYQLCPNSSMCLYHILFKSLLVMPNALIPKNYKLHINIKNMLTIIFHHKICIIYLS